MLGRKDVAKHVAERPLAVTTTFSRKERQLRLAEPAPFTDT
jgi:hypothetical protein